MDLINITDIQANETNVNWLDQGEKATATVLNRPLKQVSAIINDLIDIVNGYVLSDAATLDGLDSTQFLRSDIDDEMDGTLTINKNNIYALILNKESNTYNCGLTFRVNDVNNWLLYNTTNSDLSLQSRNYNTDGSYRNTIWTVNWDTGIQEFKATPTVWGNSIFHAGLSEIQVNTFKSSNSSIQSLTNGAVVLNGSSGTILMDTYGQKRISWNDGGGNFCIKSGVNYNGSNEVYAIDSDGASEIILSSDTVTGKVNIRTAGIGNAGDIITWTNNFLISDVKDRITINGHTIWHSGNDGSGSGLDADFLDGLGSIQFLRSDASDELNGQLTINYDAYNGLVLNKTADTFGQGIAYHTNDILSWNLFTTDDENDLRLQSFEYKTDGSSKNTIWTVDWATGIQNFHQTPTVDGDLIYHEGNISNYVPNKLSTASGSAPSYSARAWVVFNGREITGSDATIKASGNVSAVTYVSTGTYDVWFTTAMPDINYAICGTAARGNNDHPEGILTLPKDSKGDLLTTKVTVITRRAEDGDPSNYSHVSVVIFR